MTARAHPSVLWLVRHGESEANLASERAHAEGEHQVGLPMRDADVGLSPRGVAQAREVGRRFRRARPHARPTVVLASPFARTRQTAEAIAAAAGWGKRVPWVLDERLRERDQGIFTGLTGWGIAERYPEHARQREALGKLYFRPPGGESWCDVILRLRSLTQSWRREYPGERILLVTHEVVVLCMRYLLEGLSEAELLKIGRSGPVAHCALTEYHWDARGRARRVHRSAEVLG